MYKELLRKLQQLRTLEIECNIEDCETIERELKREIAAQGSNALLRFKQTQFGLLATYIAPEDLK